MYDELIKLLREISIDFGESDHVSVMMIEAADAIEELQKQLREEKVDNVNLTGWLAEEHAKLDKAEIENIKLREEFARYRGKHRWIPVTERLPEESEGLNWHEDMMIRFTSVLCCDAKTGTLEVRNRLQGKMTGNEYLDQYTKDTDWHWSKSWWEPTHWMPIVPLPEPPKDGES